MKPMRAGFLACVCALAVLGGLRAAPAATEWKCYTYLPNSTDPVYQALVSLGDTLEKATGGQLTLHCNVGGSLPIKSSAIPTAIRGNVLQFGLADSNSYTGLVPLAGVLSLPGLYSSDAQIKKAIEILIPVFDAELKKQNVKLLGISYYPVQTIWGTGKISTLADIKGTKIRVTTPELAEFATRFGAIPVTIDSPEVSTALQRGVVSTVFTATAGGGRLWHDLLKSNLRLPVNYVPVVLIANQANFDGLPPAVRDQVAAQSRKTADAITDGLKTTEVTLTDQYSKEGITVVPPSPADEKRVTDTMRPYWAEWAKAHGPDAQALLQKILTALGK